MNQVEQLTTNTRAVEEEALREQFVRLGEKNSPLVGLSSEEASSGNEINEIVKLKKKVEMLTTEVKVLRCAVTSRNNEVLSEQVESLLNALELRDAAFEAKKVRNAELKNFLAEKSTEVETLQAELELAAITREDMQGNFQKRIDELVYSSKQTTLQLQSDLRSIQMVCFQWEAKYNAKEMTLLSRLKLEKTQWEEHEAIYRQKLAEKRVNVQFAQLVEEASGKRGTDEGKFITQLISKLNKELEKALLHPTSQDASSPSSHPTLKESDILKIAEYLRQIEDEFMKQVRGMREQFLGEVIQLELKHRQDIKHLELWFEQRSGSNRTETQLREKLQMAKVHHSSEIARILKHNSEINKHRDEEMERLNISKAKQIKELQQKAINDLAKQQHDIQVNTITPLNEELAELKHLLSQQEERTLAQIKRANSNLQQQLDITRSILEAEKKQSIETVIEVNQQSSAFKKQLNQLLKENKEKIATVEKLTVDLSTAKKTVTQLEKALQKNNATLVEERELFEKQLIDEREQREYLTIKLESTHHEEQEEQLSKLQEDLNDLVRIEEAKSTQQNESLNELLNLVDVLYSYRAQDATAKIKLKQLAAKSLDELKHFMEEVVFIYQTELLSEKESTDSPELEALRNRLELVHTTQHLIETLPADQIPSTLNEFPCDIAHQLDNLRQLPREYHSLRQDQIEAHQKKLFNSILNPNSQFSSLWYHTNTLNSEANRLFAQKSPLVAATATTSTSASTPGATATRRQQSPQDSSRSPLQKLQYVIFKGNKVISTNTLQSSTNSLAEHGFISYLTGQPIKPAVTQEANFRRSTKNGGGGVSNATMRTPPTNADQSEQSHPHSLSITTYTNPERSSTAVARITGDEGEGEEHHHRHQSPSITQHSPHNQEDAVRSRAISFKQARVLQSHKPNWSVILPSLPDKPSKESEYTEDPSALRRRRESLLNAASQQVVEGQKQLPPPPQQNNKQRFLTTLHFRSKSSNTKKQSKPPTSTADTSKKPSFAEIYANIFSEQTSKPGATIKTTEHVFNLQP